MVDDDYGAWLYTASRFVEAQVGLGIDDLEDWEWRDRYEQEDSPAQAARDFIQYIGWPG